MHAHSSFLNLFPPPKFLAMPSAGIDISDRAVRYVELVNKDGHVALGHFGEYTIPEGIVSEGQIIDIPRMREIIRLITRENRTQFARVSLPEQHGYIVKMELPLMAKRDIREALELQIEEHVPITPASAVFDYELIPCEPPIHHYDLGISAMPRTVIDNYLAIFEDTGVTPLSFELEAQAMARAVLPRNCETTMLIDIGLSRTGIFIMSQGLIRYTTTVNVGGLALTKLLAERFSIPVNEAKKLKETQGLIQLPESADVATALTPMASSLQDEIRRHYQYWDTHQNDANEERAPIKHIVLCGGESNMPGLPDYLTRELDLSVSLANPWRNIVDFNEYIPEIPLSKSLQYTTAIGLAMLDHEPQS